MEIAGLRDEYADYSPATSHSATLAPPSPETDSTPTMAAAETFPEGRRASNVQQFAALGHLKYAPATQTTVVTTTTTTTTSFPPLLLKGPRHLCSRDPKQYPLAASPTPESIKKFSFDIQGRPVCFAETDDLKGPLLQVGHARTEDPFWHTAPLEQVILFHDSDISTLENRTNSCLCPVRARSQHSTTAQRHSTFSHKLRYRI
jgi:hypothetical protein